MNYRYRHSNIVKEWGLTESMINKAEKLDIFTESKKRNRIFEILRMRSNGIGQKEIGKKFSVTKTRIAQIEYMGAYIVKLKMYENQN